MTLIPTNRSYNVSEDTRISPTYIKQLHDRIRTLEASESHLRRVVESFQQMVESVPDGITFIENGRIAYNNLCSQDMFGPPGTETGGLLGIHLAAPHERARLQQVVDKIQRTGLPPEELQFWIVRPNGERCCIHNRYAPMYRDNSLVGRYVITTDITELAQREREFQSIAAISSALRKANSTQEMFPVIVEQAQRLLLAEHAALMLLENQSGDLVIQTGAGKWEAWAGTRIPSGQGLAHQVIADGVPFFSNAPWSDVRLEAPEYLDGLRTLICFPLIAQDKTLGVLWIGSQGAISPSEMGMLSALTDIAANALHRANAHEETQASIQRLQALHTIDMAITSSLDLQITLDVLLEQVITKLQITAADIFTFCPQTHTLELVSQRGFQAPLPACEIPMGGSWAGKIVLERKRSQILDLHAAGDGALRIPALEKEQFGAYLGVPLVAKGVVKGVLEIFHREPINPDPAWLDFLEALGTQAAIAIDSSHLFYDLQRSNMELMLAYDATLEGWSRALDLRDKETEGHTQRVTSLTVELARDFGLRDTELVHVRRGALLHNIGKMGIPDGILRKPGPLTDDEWGLMRQHPVFAYDLLSPVTYLAPALHIPLCHHEYWDGSGYPRGLKGEEIPLPARIFAVIDVWDALRSDRPYRPAWSEEAALEYIQKRAEHQFDPMVVERFVNLYRSSLLRAAF
jgi:PAS domain S-box-containing protein